MTFSLRFARLIIPFLIISVKSGRVHTHLICTEFNHKTRLRQGLALHVTTLLYCANTVGLILDSTGFAKPKVHAEVAAGLVKKSQKIVANDENYALAA